MTTGELELAEVSHGRDIQFEGRPGGPPGAGTTWMTDAQLRAAALRMSDRKKTRATLADYAAGKSDAQFDAYHVAKEYLKLVEQNDSAHELIHRAAHLLADKVGALKMHPSIQLASGKYFDFLEPWNTPLDISDIAAGLSRVCRFTGQLRLDDDEVYTVAQHAVLASENCEPGFELAALHHDDSESVMNDMASPLKQLLPCYKEIEERVEECLAKWHGTPYPMTPQVKAIDLRMLCTEKRDIMPHVEGDEAWKMLDGIEPLPFPIRPWSHAEARHRYLHRHRFLTTGELPPEGAKYAAPHEFAPQAYVEAYNAARGFTGEQAAAKAARRAAQAVDYFQRQREQQQLQHDQSPFN